MNSGATSQRVYDDLKQRILAGCYRPGARLEPAHLGELLNSSATPIRESLHMLVGEGLVETGLSTGFHVAELDAPALEDLYRWTSDVMGLVARAVVGGVTPASQDKYPEAVAGLFANFARRSTNPEHARAVDALNDRLHAVRRAEASVIEDWRSELGALARDLSGSTRSARTAITRFHRRRVRLAAEIVRQRYRLS